MKSSGLLVLAIGLALAIAIPLLFVVTTRLDVALSGVVTEPATRSVAVGVAMFSLPSLLILFGGNAFGIRTRQGRTYASAFEATQACGIVRMAGLKVLVRSVCLLAAVVTVGTSVWTSVSVIPFDVLGDNDAFIDKSRNPVSGLIRAIESAVGTMNVYELLALAFVAAVVMAVMVASRAAFTALRARYPRRLTMVGSVVLLYLVALVLLVMARESGFEIPLIAIFRATFWIAVSAMVLAKGYLVRRVFAERLISLGHAGVATLIAAAFGVSWLTVLRAADVQLGAMTLTAAVSISLPMLLPLTAAALAPWALSRVRHM